MVAANLVENKMKTLFEYCRGVVQQLRALQAPFHLPCLWLRAELLSELSCWAGWQSYGEVEIRSRDARVFVCECVCVCNSGAEMHSHRFTTQADGRRVGLRAQ